MSSDARIRGYWREEFSLIAVLLLFFAGIVVFSFRNPFDARLFPLVIGTAGILLTLVIAVEQMRRQRAGAADAVDERDPATQGRLAALCDRAVVRAGVRAAFWLFGFVVASLAAMLLMPALMGYSNRRQLVIVAVVTVALLALIFPYLLNVDLPHGLVGDWLIDRLGLRAA